MSLAFYDLSNDLIREILCNYLEPIDVHSCLLTSKIFHVLLDIQLYNIIKKKTRGFVWGNCILSGSLLTCQKIYLLSNQLKLPINTHYDNETTFRYCCRQGFLELAKWLYELGIQQNLPINIHAIDDYAFKQSCMNGRLKVAKWLFELSIQLKSPINIYKCHELRHIMEEECLERYMGSDRFNEYNETIDWLHKLSFIIHIY